MKRLFLIVAFSILSCCMAEDVRLLDLDPADAQQIIDKQDQNLNYAPKIDTNVPAVRYLGDEPHHVLEDIYLARQYHGQDGLGGYLYGYNVPDIAKTERKKPSGDLKGSYNYIAGNGQEIKVEYWDNGTGFHQVDNVPLILPKQVEDSPAVKAAKEKFLARWHEEAERNSHPVPYPYNSDNGAQAQPTLTQQYQQQQTASSTQYQPNYNQPQPQYNQAYNQNQGRDSYQPNEIDYSGQSSNNQNVYSPGSKTGQQQQSADRHNNEEEEETTGPPKGFFYKFDYPVGIIVNKGEVANDARQIRDIYDDNKAKFESQLKGQTTGSKVGRSEYLVGLVD